MATIDPSRESFSQLFVKTAPDKPVTMLNLLRFKEQAEYTPECKETPCTGREAYARYTANALKALVHHRSAGLADARLIAMQQ
ncbi:hypothetical protein [Rhodoferax mekongensis]|uniref:Uncharacterized protein n=1 Tax=Rhodoferax mekongensis TaxID=3068341 RepID=A0ABZ0AWE6_9BURK|nr:hypothetical protein [Rhodoferax sp. TBRC 17307]WNO03453.1 hypothetical protein RAN89_11005 [Rhodoferax sp. TBRC 17307]